MPEESIALILQRLEKIEAALSELDGRYIRSDVIQIENKHQGERIGALELDVQSLQDDKKWLVRIIVGAVLLAVIGMVLGDSGVIG